MIKELTFLIGIAVILAASGCIGGEDNKGIENETKNIEAKTTPGPLTQSYILSKIKGGNANKVTITGGDVVVYHEVMGDGWKQISDLYDVGEIFKELFKDPRVTSAKVIVPLYGFDKYGQKQTTIAMSFLLTNTTASRINWDNFNIDNLPDVADEAYINPNLDS
jgi:hypothetical protein